MPSFGFIQSVGTVQAYLQENQLEQYSARDVGWITGVYTFLTMFLGIQTGPLVDVHGPTYLAPLAAACTIPMFFLLAECKIYWHLILCLGVLGGIGNAFSTTIGIAVIGKIFHRRRGLAMGIALAGSSTGGIIFPLALRQTFPTWGWRWSMRALGFIVLGIMLLGIACLSPFSRLVSKAQDKTRSIGLSKKSAAMDFSAFRSVPFSLITGAIFLLEFVIFGATAILPTLVAWAGFPVESRYNMVAILNGLSSLGRILPGMVGDHVGHFNILLVMVLFTLISTAVTLTVFGSSRIEALYAFSALWGLGTGSFLSLTPVCMGKTCEPKDYGRYYGTMNFVISFSLLLTMPISGQMLDSLGSTALSGLYLVVVFVGGLLIFAARSTLVGSWFNVFSKL
ncbi:MFS monocarboxylate [Colletotrichum kahawae]|uniref:MFS monocarboxylate n=1 Tax=Colletotrichum kahawae TaxID=34407 RepID=A0AAD9Y3G4_COLKA|nr:MFS monocarboxylate [Colletotrichum kahawae]